MLLGHDPRNDDLMVMLGGLIMPMGVARISPRDAAVLSGDAVIEQMRVHDGRVLWLDQRVATEKIWASPAQYSPEASRAKGALLFDYGVQPKSVVHQYNAIVKSPPREEALRDVQVPTLVLHGTADTLIDPSGGERTAEVMPNSTLISLDGMGHDLPEFYWPVIAGHVADHAHATTDEL